MGMCDVPGVWNMWYVSGVSVGRVWMWYVCNFWSMWGAY